ncbi:ImmA/IrrE family metallo-endopeptidase [Rummeliibacillus stabekisii]|uniref:ImmA/IrrE family metallo-endopeptidase n=1 Tax=Rummeliibacillus stabekisii TaxID=241244 RepID=UPI0037127C99
MGWIKDVVEKYIKKYKTNCPFELAKLLNIQVIFWELPDEVDGMYYYTKRNKFIFINNKLAEYKQRFVCAHELGHSDMHTKISTPFMRSSTWFSVDKIEIEANIFAAELLISDESLRECENLTTEQIAALHKVPTELVELKRKGLL